VEANTLAITNIYSKLPQQVKYSETDVKTCRSRSGVLHVVPVRCPSLLQT